MTDDQWELRVCVQCNIPSIAKRVLIMAEDMSVSRVYYCPQHGPLSIAVVVAMRAIRARHGPLSIAVVVAMRAIRARRRGEP